MPKTPFWKRTIKSLRKSFLALAVYRESHDGLRSLPAAVQRTWRSGGWSAIHRKIRFYRTLTQELDTLPPWENGEKASLEQPVEISNPHFRQTERASERAIEEQIAVAIPVANFSASQLSRCLSSMEINSGSIFLLVNCKAIGKQCESLRANTSLPHFEVVVADSFQLALQQLLALTVQPWLALLDSDCQLRKPLRNGIKNLSSSEAVDWVYADALLSEEPSRFRKGLLRPRFSPEFLLSQNFIRGVNWFRRETLHHVFSELAGDVIDDDAFLYEVLLHVAEQVPSARVIHHAEVVVQLDDSAARGKHGSKHTQIETAELAATRRSLMRRGIQGHVEATDAAPFVRTFTFAPKQVPAVNIFIATRDACDLVKACVTSIREKTRYPNYNIVVIDNQSQQQELADYLAAESQASDFFVFSYDRAFNHSEMHNLAVKQFESELIVLMNNDVELITEGWLEQLVGSLELADDLAGVGPMLLYPDGLIQHAGVGMGLYSGAGHFFRNLSPHEPTYLNRAVSLQRLSGCTAALLLLRRSAYLEVGGFDGERYAATFNDVDLWLRLQQAGYGCLYNPTVRALHFESRTRPLISAVEQEALDRLQEDWGEQLQNDPYLHPHISRQNDWMLGFRSQQQLRTANPTQDPDTKRQAA